MYQPSVFMERMDSKNKILSLNLYRGKEAFGLLSNCNFQNAWDNLYKICPWSTVFQHREFITSWYNTYQEDFQPLIIMEKQSDEITGMVHLAIPIKDANKNRNIQIIGAGKFDAEYQVWLTEPDNNEFIKEALKLLLKEYPKCKVIFRYIPPTAPLNWLESDSWKNRMTIQGSKRPLIGPNHPEFPKLLRKRHLKAKYNRISRAGELKLEDITDSKQFSDLLDFLAIQYDFRQGALFNKNQFREDHQKSEFLKELFDHGLLHVSTLNLSNKITAAIISMKDKGWVHLAGLITHSPFYSKLSPGLVQLYMLAKKYSFDNIEAFDLTPGNDPYKDRLATHYDTTYELVVTDNKLFKLKRAARKNLYDWLYKKGIIPQKVKLQVEKNIYLFKNKYKYFLSPSKNGSKTSSGESQLSNNTTNGHFSFNVNHLEDLLNYKQVNTILTRWEFLEDALNRYDNGQVSYSISQDNKLLFIAWVSILQEETNNEEKKGQTTGPTKAVIDHYILNKPDIQDQVFTELEQVIKSNEAVDQVVKPNNLE